MFGTSCIDRIAAPQKETIEIINSTIIPEQCGNNRNLFIKVETNLNETQEIIDNVSIELIYLIPMIPNYTLINNQPGRSYLN